MNGIVGEALLSFIQRIENLNEEIKGLSDDKSEIFKEAKGQGFDTNAMKQVIRIRAMDPSERADQEALVDGYLHAVGNLGVARVEREAVQQPETANVG
jgi:uncharacterized protein (UPF0335 family)